MLSSRSASYGPTQFSTQSAYPAPSSTSLIAAAAGSSTRAQAPDLLRTGFASTADAPPRTRMEYALS